MSANAGRDEHRQRGIRSEGSRDRARRSRICRDRPHSFGDNVLDWSIVRGRNTHRDGGDREIARHEDLESELRMSAIVEDQLVDGFPSRVVDGNDDIARMEASLGARRTSQHGVNYFADEIGGWHEEQTESGAKLQSARGGLDDNSHCVALHEMLQILSSTLADGPGPLRRTPRLLFAGGIVTEYLRGKLDRWE
jgi:hypothetical protein